ncbi:MAG: hypothetical protein SPJ83_10665 [Helicobacter sp.]|nr:hypothetical protein [Helicobacter sp.]MDY5823227.1 hypothetical protein [Helicobacter sp.]
MFVFMFESALSSYSSQAQSKPNFIETKKEMNTKLNAQAKISTHTD